MERVTKNMSKISILTNPVTNRLGDGVTEDDILQAVGKSGYPLQTWVASLLKERIQEKDRPFFIQEEWSFIDRDTHDLRNLDIHMRDHMWTPEEVEALRVRPELDLFIECKQSSLPYVFFLSDDPPWARNFPIIAGLKGSEVMLSTDDDRSTWSHSIVHVLGLSQHPFVEGAPYNCLSFSKCVWPGKNNEMAAKDKGVELPTRARKIELSGSDVFHGLVLPLVKALNHFEDIERPVPTARFFDCHISLALGVLDAPMIGIRMANGVSTMEYVPWVRVIRHESVETRQHRGFGRMYAIDVVHKDYLDDYMDKEVQPFANEFSERVKRHGEVLAACRGFVSGFGRDSSLDEIDKRLRPPRPQDLK